jgi:hypothetical protein
MTSNTNLIVGDGLFLLTVTIISATDGFKKNIIVTMLLVIAFATCLIRHINHYKHTGRIY